MLRKQLLAAGMLAMAAACSGGDSTGSGSTDTNVLVTQDVANLAADAVQQDVDMMAGMDGTVGSLASDALVASLVDPHDRPLVAGCNRVAGRWACPPQLRDGLTLTREVTFFDAGGQTQTDYDPLLTASIHVVATVTGDVSHDNWSATIERHRDFTITGLAGTETTRTVNGTGSESVSRSHVNDAGETRSYDLTGNSVGTDIVIPVRGSGTPPWPLSGTITRTYTIEFTSGPRSGESVTRTVVITFNGSANPTGTVNGDEFTFNLAARRAIKHGQGQ